MRLNNYINESSLSRLRQHMLEHDTGTITAFRDAEDCGNGPNITKKQNKARNKILLANLRKEGYSVTKVKGGYIENYGTKDAKEVGEEVFFVVDINDKGNLKNKLMREIKMIQKEWDIPFIYVTHSIKESRFLGNKFLSFKKQDEVDFNEYRENIS